jgi:hypothetical protein
MDMFANQDRPQIRQKGEELRERGGGGDGDEGNVVHFERRDQPAHTDAVRLVAVGYHNYLSVLVNSILEGHSAQAGYLMTAADEIGAEHVDVALDAAYSWMEEVGDHP